MEIKEHITATQSYELPEIESLLAKYHKWSYTPLVGTTQPYHESQSTVTPFSFSKKNCSFPTSINSKNQNIYSVSPKSKVRNICPSWILK